MFLIFPEETLASHFKPKQLSFEFFCHVLVHFYNYQTPYVTYFECV